MADVNANIDVNINTSNALSQLKNLQSQISKFHSSIAKSSEAAALAQKSLQKNLLSSINSIGAFSAELRTVKTTAESFTTSLEKNKFSMREYFRYAGASTKSFGKLFKSEFDTIQKVAEDRVKKLQTQYIKLGRDSAGAMKSIAVIPDHLDLSSLSTQTQLASQRQAIFNQLMKQGSTNLLNFGKNTQWAGRQLMVGFSLPLLSVGSMATKTFMDMETQALRFKKVYGDLFTPQSETQQQLANIKELGKQFTRYGIAVSQTVGLAADAAAAGFQGLDLQRQTTEATRLSVLGQIDANQALQTTISLQNAFGISSADLAGNIDFLNAVENQTVTSLDDITTAIPKVAPVIRQLGGNVKDLAFFLTAMKEGGVNASEGANALKSGLASLINPSAKASSMLASMGINIKNIVTQNKGNLRATVVEFAKALDKLDPLARARAIEQMFGKFQFARISTLFQNVTKTGTQAARVLDLANASASDLANLSQQELGITADSAMNKFKKSVEDLKLALVPVGETFLKAVTPIINFVSGILDKFNGLSDGVKKFITIMTVGVAGIGPIVLMAFGLLANGIANIIKLFLTLRSGYLRLTGQSQVLGEQTRYLNTEQMDAAAAAHSLNQSHATLTQTFNVEKNALRQLIAAYESAIRASSSFAAANPGMMVPRFRGKKMATGGMVVGPGTGTSDSVPTMLSNGEAVISAKNVQKYPHLTAGLVAGNIPGFSTGAFPAYTNAVTLLKKSTNYALNTRKGGSGISASDLAAEFSQGGAGIQSPIITAIAEALGAKRSPDIVKMLSNDPNLAKFGSSISQGIAQELLSLGNNKVADQQLTQIYQKVARQQAQNYGSVYSNAVEKFFTEITTFEDTSMKRRRSSGLLESIGRAQTTAGISSYRNKSSVYDKVSKALGLSSTEGLVKAHVADRQMLDLSSITTPTKQLRDALTRQAKGLVVIVERGVKQAQKSASPSQVAKGLGEDFGNGYAQGIDATSGKAKNASTNLVGDTTNSADIAIQKSIARHNRKLAKRGMVAGAIAPKLSMLSRARGIAGTAMSKLSSPKVGFGLSSALMMGSMLPGKAGEVAGQLSTVGFLVQALKLLPGPLKLVAGGLLATYGIIKLVNIFRDKERQAIEGLGNAAVVSGNKLKTLGDFFGVAPTKLPYESLGSAPVAMSRQQRTRVDELRANSGFKKDFGKDISALKKTNSSNAKMILQSMGIQLNARGFAQDQIKTIIQALQIESGKTDIVLDFKNIGVVNDKNIQNQATDISRKFSETFGKGMKKTLVEYTGPRSAPLIKVITEWTKSQKALMKGAAASMFGVYQGLIGQLQNGTIDATAFNKQIATLNTQIQSMPKAVQLALIREMFAKLGPDAIKATNGIKSARDQLAAFLALSYGTLSLDSSVLKVLNNPDKYDPKTIGRAQAQLQKAMKDGLDFQKQIAKMTQQENGTGGTGGGTGTGTTDILSKEAKLTIARLRKELDALKTKRDIIKQTNDELMRQYDYQQKLTDLQQSALQAKAQGNYIQAAMLQQQQYHTTAQFNTETRNLQLDKKIMLLEDRISALSAGQKVTAAEKALLKAKAGMAFGGLVRGPGTAMSDSVKARVGFASGGMINLSNGEYVMRQAAVRTYGTSFMNAVNNSKVGVNDSASSSSVYNVTMTINGGNNNPNEIADQVIKKLNVMSSRGNKTNKVGG